MRLGGFTWGEIVCAKHSVPKKGGGGEKEVMAGGEAARRGKGVRVGVGRSKDEE